MANDDERDERQDNGFDADALASFVDRIEQLQGEIDAIMAQAREDAAPIREDMKQVRREAHDAGIGKQEFAAVMRKRRFEHKAAHAGDSLDLAQRSNYASYLESLEKLAAVLPGLGEAARDRARARA